MPGDDAIKLADACAQAGLVTHDQLQHTKEARRAAEQPLSVTLNEAGGIWRGGSDDDCHAGS